MTLRDQHLHKILSRFDERPETSQRVLSRELGIALGLTNVLVRNVVRRGWVRAIHVKPNRVRYLLTPAGLAEKGRMSRDAVRNSIRFYAAARDRIRSRFHELSELGPRRVVFLGAGEVAEIGHICIQGTALKLVGVVDAQKAGADFFGIVVSSPAELSPTHVAGAAYDRGVVMSFADPKIVLAQIAHLAIHPDRVDWL